MALSRRHGYVMVTSCYVMTTCHDVMACRHNVMMTSHDVTATWWRHRDVMMTTCRHDDVRTSRWRHGVAVTWPWHAVICPYFSQKHMKNMLFGVPKMCSLSRRDVTGSSRWQSSTSPWHGHDVTGKCSSIMMTFQDVTMRTHDIMANWKNVFFICFSKKYGLAPSWQF